MAVPLGFGDKGVALFICAYFVHKFFGTLGYYVVIATAIIVQILIYYQNNQVWKKAGVPGPKPMLFVGNFLQLFGKGFHIVDVEWTKQYGKVFGTYAFTQADLVISDIDLLKQVLVKDFNNFPNRRNIAVFSDKTKKNVAAKILSFLKDDEWKNVRNTITPTFTGGKLKNMEQQVDKCVETFLEILSKKARIGEDVDIKDLLSACTMEIIAKCAFATDIDCQNNPDDLFFYYAKKANQFSFKDWDAILFVLFPWTLFQIKQIFGITIFRRDIENFFGDNLVKIIEERKRNPMTIKPDYLQLLINASEEYEKASDKIETVHDDAISHDIGGKRVPLTDAQIISQCFLFLIAGYETTAVTMTNVAYLLALNSDVQEKCYEEVFNVVQDGRVNYSQVQSKLPYLDAVISETLRLFPPAVRFDRQSKNDYNLNGIIVPKDAVISVAVYVIHHDEEHYPDPEKFDPERFSPEEKAKRNPFTYLPWGYGPRNCVGMRFAQMEMKMILANAILKYKFLPCDKTEPYPPKLIAVNLLKPEKTVLLKIEKRV